MAETKSEYTPLPSDERDGQRSPATPAHHAPRKKPLTLWPLVALIFFEVSGGPFGTEVRAAGHGTPTLP